MSGFGLLTLAAAAAAATALLAWAASPLLRRAGLVEATEKTDAAEVARRHACKRGLPTAGGLVFPPVFAAGAALAGALADPRVWIVLAVTAALAALGWRDDWVKARDPVRRGVRPRTKLWLPFLLGAGAAAACARLHAGGCAQALPFTALRLDPGVLIVPLAGLAVAATANACNLTDGLDGLAAGLAVPAFGAFAWVAAARGESGPAALAAVGAGAGVGFLALNRHPARLFMGDTGALALGGGLAGLALILHELPFLLLVGGVFAAEAASVMLQVWSFRRRGRRIFRCAPLHHHFEYLAWPEGRITRWFWGAGLLCAAVALLGRL